MQNITAEYQSWERFETDPRGYISHEKKKQVFLVEQLTDINDRMYETIQHLISGGNIVIVMIHKCDYNKGRLATVQNWQYVDEKFSCSYEYVLKAYQTGQPIDAFRIDPPRGYLNRKSDGKFEIIIGDGNHRITTALCLDVDIGVQLITCPDTREPIYPLSYIYQAIQQTLLHLEK